MADDRLQHYMDNLGQNLLNLGTDLVTTRVVMDNVPVHRGTFCRAGTEMNFNLFFVQFTHD